LTKAKSRIILDNVPYKCYTADMDEKSCFIYEGSKFTIKWYFDINGKSDAFNFFENASEDMQIKFLVLVKRMGDFGKIFDITKFRNEGDGIYAFKPQPDRYLSFFSDGGEIIVTNGFKKKTSKLPKREKDIALKYMQDYIKRKAGG